MNVTVLTKSYNKIPFCEKEILRYAMCKEGNEQERELLSSCIKEAEHSFSYMVCYCALPIAVSGDICDFGAFSLSSKSLAKNLEGCSKAVIFSATVGINIDRLIAKYSRIMPSRSVMMHAIGTQQVEALCDAFCTDMECETTMHTTMRFSPGYGDLSLDAQRDILGLLGASKRIGVCLNDSMLMSPSKSVTAIVGLKKNKEEKTNKCNKCNNKDCSFRGVV